VGFNPGEVTKKLKIRSENCGFFYAFVPPVVLPLSQRIPNLCSSSLGSTTKFVFWGFVCLGEVIFYWYGLSVLIQAYKATLKVLYPTDLLDLNFCPNPNPKFKKLILVYNWQ